MTEHLQVTTSDRGFDAYPEIPGESGGHVSVYESSAASGPHIWLTAEAPVKPNDPDGPTVRAPMHLSAENAWRLAEQLQRLVRDHYQGDASPVVVDPLRELAEWLVSLGHPESMDRRGVRLADIVRRAREALAEDADHA